MGNPSIGGCAQRIDAGEHHQDLYSHIKKVRVGCYVERMIDGISAAPQDTS